MRCRNMIEYKEENKAYFILSVTDIQKAKEFYKDIFGFEVIFDLKISGKEIGWTEMSLPFDGARLGLNLLQEGKVQQGSGKLSFYVKDVNAVKKYLKSKNVEIKDIKNSDSAMFFHNDSVIDAARSIYGYDVFIMLDPFGNEIFFVGDDKKVHD